MAKWVHKLCHLSVFYWAVFFSLIITDPPLWLRWFKGLISVEVGILICKSGDVIRDVMGRSVTPSTPQPAPLQYNNELWFQDWFSVAVPDTILSCEWVLANGWNLLSNLMTGQQITTQPYAGFLYLCIVCSVDTILFTERSIAMIFGFVCPTKL